MKVKIFLIGFFLLIILTTVFYWHRTKTKNSFTFVPPKEIEQVTQQRPFSISAWLPWWDYDLAEEEFIDHQSLFKIISPFAYILQKDGELVLKITNLKQKTSRYQSLSAIKVVPSVYNDFDGERVSLIINSEVRLQAHIKALVDLVQANQFDGLEIDYEYLKKYL